LDDLLTKLLIHEIHFKEDEEEAQTENRVGFQTTNEELYPTEEESSEEDKESMTMIARRLKKIFKSRRFDPKKLYKKESSSKKNERFSKGTKTSNNKHESNLDPYFGCGWLGHVVKDFPILQKKVEKRKQKAKKEFKRVAAWSDSDSEIAIMKKNNRQTFALW